MRSLDIGVELTLVDEILYLILKFVAVVGVVSYVTVIATILILVPLYSLFPNGEGSSEVDPPLISLKHLNAIGVQLSIISVSG